ncbi:MAG TPA: MFS transporter [Acidiphilium sp.]
MTETAPSPLTIDIGSAEIRRAVLASIIGNGMEWFDFIVIGSFIHFISIAFFPAASPGVSILRTLGAFAAGFVVRPFGGILLGLYADRAGRRKALALLIVVMAFGTLLVGITPSYRQIGIAAPVIFVFARVLQGLSVGGEFASAASMLVEYAPAGKRMFYGSFEMASQGFALLVGSLLAFSLARYLPHAAMRSWGWRVPFILGAFIGPVGYYIRHHVAESPVLRRLQEHHDLMPRDRFAPYFARHKAALLCGIGVIVVGAALNFLWHGYMPLYVTRHLHLPLYVALFGNSASGLIAVIGYPLAGKLADRVGAYRVFFPVVIAFSIAAYPLYHFVVSDPTIPRLVTAQIIASLFLTLMSGPHPGMLTDLFPARVRATGVAISYNVAVTCFGGLAPLAVTWLIQVTKSDFVPAGFQIGAAVISLIVVAIALPRARAALGWADGSGIDAAMVRVGEP